MNGANQCAQVVMQHDGTMVFGSGSLDLESMIIVSNATTELETIRFPWISILSIIKELRTRHTLPHASIMSNPNMTIGDKLRNVDIVSPTEHELAVAATTLYAMVIKMQTGLSRMVRILELVTSFYFANHHICGMGLPAQKTLTFLVDNILNIRLTLTRTKWKALGLIFDDNMRTALNGEDADPDANMTMRELEEAAQLDGYDFGESWSDDAKVFLGGAAFAKINSTVSPFDVELAQQFPLWITPQFIDKHSHLNFGKCTTFRDHLDEMPESPSKEWAKQYYASKGKPKELKRKREEHEAQHGWEGICDAYERHGNNDGQDNSDGIAIEHFLSRGSHGKVFVCSMKQKMFVVKIVPKSEPDFWKEVDFAKLMGMQSVDWPPHHQLVLPYNLRRVTNGNACEWTGNTSTPIGPTVEWAGSCSNSNVIVLEYIKDSTLDSYLKNTKAATCESLSLFLSTFGEAVVFILLRLAHEYRVIHNDFHTDNVMLEQISPETFAKEGTQCGCFRGYEMATKYYRMRIIDSGMCTFARFDGPYAGHTLHELEHDDVTIFFKVALRRLANGARDVFAKEMGTIPHAAIECLEWFYACVVFDHAVAIYRHNNTHMSTNPTTIPLDQKRNWSRSDFTHSIPDLFDELKISHPRVVELRETIHKIKQQEDDMARVTKEYLFNRHLVVEDDGLICRRGTKFAKFGKVFSLRNLVPFKIAPSLHPKPVF